jgi:hypothetical protein
MLGRTEITSTASGFASADTGEFADAAASCAADGRALSVSRPADVARRIRLPRKKVAE